MKYFKFAQISEETGISWAIAQPVSGPSWPNISGLDLTTSIQLAHSPIYYLAQVDDAAVANPDNHIFELSFEEYALEIKNHVMHQLNSEKESIYAQEQSFRDSTFSKYHDTASLAGIYKYQQAKDLLVDNSAAAPDVRNEASIRGVDPVILASKIIQNHESFRQQEIKIAGIRGKIWDRLNSYQFNLTNPFESLDEFMSTEVLGTEIRKEFENGETVDKTVDITVRKYLLSLDTRFYYE